MSSTCLSTPTLPSSLISSPLNFSASISIPTSFVTRDGSKLLLDGQNYKAVGPNIYWLGLDENVIPNPSWPSRSRVSEVMAIAATMGANTVRSTTLGVSVGTGLSVENALGVFNEEAFEAIDWAVWVAKSYGIRLILPLTDQYDYYHGGIPTFLRWRNLSATSPSDYGPFYDTTSLVFSDFKLYISTLINHRSNITGLTLAEEPTILAFETGNELGGWGLSGHPPPVEWTTAISSYLKELAPNTLVISGSYGVRKEELGIESVDIHSTHYYPPYSWLLKNSAKLASSHNKAFIVGEFDWTNRYYKPQIYATLGIPFLLAALVFLLPARWWPWSLSLDCCSRRRKSRRQRRINGTREGYFQAADLTTPNASSPSASTLKLSPLENTFPPPSTSNSFQTQTLLSTSPLNNPRPPFYSRILLMRRYQFAFLIIFILAPIIGGLLSAFVPTPLNHFLSVLEGLATTDQLAGDMYWSLFGKDNECCQFVQHGDGYTLHYPSDPTSSASGNGNALRSGESVVELMRHAWNVRGETPSWVLGGGGGWTLRELPDVSCPQRALTIPSNATWTGGNGTITRG